MSTDKPVEICGLEFRILSPTLLQTTDGLWEIESDDELIDETGIRHWFVADGTYRVSDNFATVAEAAEYIKELNRNA